MTLLPAAERTRYVVAAMAMRDRERASEQAGGGRRATGDRRRRRTTDTTTAAAAERSLSACWRSCCCLCSRSSVPLPLARPLAGGRIVEQRQQRQQRPRSAAAPPTYPSTLPYLILPPVPRPSLPLPLHPSKQPSPRSASDHPAALRASVWKQRLDNPSSHRPPSASTRVPGVYF